MTNEEKIARLSDLFKQKEHIDAEILRIINDDGTVSVTVVKPINAVFPVMKKGRRGRKPKADEPVKEKQKRVYIKRNERPSLKIALPTQYRCNDCEEEFVSERPALDVVCPTCNSVHVKKSNIQ